MHRSWDGTRKLLVFLCGRVTSVTPTVSAKQSVTEVDLYVDTDTIQAKIMHVDLLLKECNDILTFFLNFS